MIPMISDAYRDVIVSVSKMFYCLAFNANFND